MVFPKLYIMRKPKLSLFVASLLAVVSVNQISVESSLHRTRTNWQLEFGLEAVEARRSGGRSGGGSFRSPSRTSPSRSRSGGGSSSGSGSRTTPSTRNAPSNTNSAPTRGSGGRTGGRTGGGSFQRTPAPTSPSNNRTNSTPAPRSTPAPTAPGYNSQPQRRGNSYELEVEVNNNPAVPYYYVPGSPNDQPSNSGESGNATTREGGAAASGGSSAVGVQTSSQSRRGFPTGLVVLLLLGIAGGLILWWLMSRDKGSGQSAAAAAGELENDVVTVTKLQLGLLAEARELQSELTQLSLDADLESSEGLAEFLSECSLALLRKPEYWTHARTESTTYKSREDAQKAFGELSMTERSKFTAETFSNMEGRVRERELNADEAADPGEYIVVTLLVGTEDDKPLFESVYSADEVQAALQKLGAVTPDYLLVFELLWTPQAESDSLTSEDLLLEYSDMVQL